MGVPELQMLVELSLGPNCFLSNACLLCLEKTGELSAPLVDVGQSVCAHRALCPIQDKKLYRKKIRQGSNDIQSVFSECKREMIVAVIRCYSIKWEL